jgi:hypothetical protein
MEDRHDIFCLSSSIFRFPFHCVCVSLPPEPCLSLNWIPSLPYLRFFSCTWTIQFSRAKVFGLAARTYCWEREEDGEMGGQTDQVLICLANYQDFKPSPPHILSLIFCCFGQRLCIAPHTAPSTGPYLLVMLTAWMVALKSQHPFLGI